MASNDINDHSRYAGVASPELKGVEDIKPEGELKIKCRALVLFCY